MEAITRFDLFGDGHLPAGGPGVFGGGFATDAGADPEPEPRTEGADATGIYFREIRGRRVLTRSEEQLEARRFVRARRAAERAASRSPIAATLLLARLRSAVLEPARILSVIEVDVAGEREPQEEAKEAAAAKALELANLAIPALEALLGDIAEVAPGRRARLLVWLGRAVRCVRFPPELRRAAREAVLEAATRAEALRSERESLRGKLRKPAPAIADKRRLMAVEQQLATFHEQYGASPEEIIRATRKLRRLEAEADTLRNQLMEVNLRLVVSVVKGYARSGLPLADLIQEGNLGLMHAIEKFDPTRGTKLSTYAVPWIRQAAQRALDYQLRTVRLPVHSADLLRRIEILQRDARSRSGEDLTARELAAVLGVSEAKVMAVTGAAPAPVPLETPLGEDGSVTLAMTIRDHAERPDERALAADLRAKIAEALSTLTDRERQVIVLRFGLGEDSREHTLEEVGRQLNVTRERVRQIEAKALERLRNPVRAAKLRHYA